MHRKDDGHFSGNGIDCSQKLTLDIRMAVHLMQERGDSWELRAGPGDIQNFRRWLMRCLRWTFQCRRFAIRAKKALLQCLR